MKRLIALGIACLTLVGCCTSETCGHQRIEYSPVFVITAIILLVILYMMIDDNRDPPSAA
jgi:hypothetical protein